MIKALLSLQNVGGKAIISSQNLGQSNFPFQKVWKKQLFPSRMWDKEINYFPRECVGQSNYCPPEFETKKPFTSIIWVTKKLFLPECGGQNSYIQLRVFTFTVLLLMDFTIYVFEAILLLSQPHLTI